MPTPKCKWKTDKIEWQKNVKENESKKWAKGNCHQFEKQYGVTFLAAVSLCFRHTSHSSDVGAVETSQSQPAGCQSCQLRAHIASLERLFTNFCEIKSQRWNQSSQLRLDIPSIPQTWRLMLWTDRKGICYLNLLHLGVLLQLLLTFRCYRGSLFERRRRNISQALSWMQQVTRAWVPNMLNQVST